MVTFSWLHLSDLHIGKTHRLKQLWQNIYEAFFEDLARIHDKCGPLDLVIFTGDLTRTGALEEFKRADSFFSKLKEVLIKLGSNPILFSVPGNHDLIRPNAREPMLRLLLELEKDHEIEEEFWHNLESPYRKIIIQAFRNYTKWWSTKSSECDSFNQGTLPGDFSASIEKDRAKLGIIGLNTSYLHLSDQAKGVLSLNTRQFNAACGSEWPSWIKKHHACLLLTHHSQTWLSQNSLHNYYEITAHNRFAVHLFGHMHDMHETSLITPIQHGAETRLVYQSPALSGLDYFGKGDEKFRRLNGYSFGKIILHEDRGELTFFPRALRIQGNRRNFVSDYQYELNEDSSTPSKFFSLMRHKKKVKKKDKVQIFPVRSDGEPIRILHLSDLHFNEDDDPEIMLQPLIADLHDSKEGLGIQFLDYLIVSGDITNTATAKEFENALEFLSDLIEEFKISPLKCIIVPGNHDLSWETKVYEWRSKRIVDLNSLKPGSFIEEDRIVLLQIENKYPHRFKNFSNQFYYPFPVRQL